MVTVYRVKQEVDGEQVPVDPYTRAQYRIFSNIERAEQWVSEQLAKHYDSVAYSLFHGAADVEARPRFSIEEVVINKVV